MIIKIDWLEGQTIEEDVIRFEEDVDLLVWYGDGTFAAFELGSVLSAEEEGEIFD